MNVSDVSFAISSVLATVGANDATIEQSTDKDKGIVYFDIQRPNVNGEELWFCFRVLFVFDSQRFAIETRQDLDPFRAEPNWRDSFVDEGGLQIWLLLCIDYNDSILEELTRP